jgi:hypothetical protein
MAVYGRLLPLTAPTGLIGKVCNGSIPGQRAALVWARASVNIHA